MTNASMNVLDTTIAQKSVRCNGAIVTYLLPTLRILLVLSVTFPWLVGCSRQKKTATPQQMEELRQQNLKRAERMRQQG
jgi:hypothetical protein